MNRFLKWLGYETMTVKTKRQQCQSHNDDLMSMDNYLKMVEYARQQNDKRMYYLMRTLAGTGIRIGELKEVTVEAIAVGKAVVFNKEKSRCSARMCVSSCISTFVCNSVYGKGWRYYGVGGFVGAQQVGNDMALYEDFNGE